MLWRVVKDGFAINEDRTSTAVSMYRTDGNGGLSALSVANLSRGGADLMCTGDFVAGSNANDGLLTFLQTPQGGIATLYTVDNQGNLAYLGGKSNLPNYQLLVAGSFLNSPIEGQNPLTYLKLTAHPLKGLAWGLYGSLFVVGPEVGNLLHLHSFHLPQSADTWVNAILLVGLMEEIPFRGFLFQKLHSLFGPSWIGLVGAMLILSLLFALIHIPLWISTGQSLLSSLFGLLLVFFVGIIACVALKLSESLWSSILIHTVYNLLTSLL